MKRTKFANGLLNGLVYALLAATAVTLAAQQANQSNPYQGTSNPPSDDTITTQAPETPPQASPHSKPSPNHYAAQPSNVAHAPQPAPPPYAAETVPNEAARGQASSAPASAPVPANSAETIPAPANDDGIVQVAPPDNASQPALNARPDMSDPDGDIVHLAPLPQGELGEGTTIRVRLMGRLSTSESQVGETFHTQVASDVMQNGQVIIPTGSQIDGKVISVSTGHTGGHGSMRLRPESVTLPDGSHFRLYAQLSGAPGSNDRIENEGLVTPGSRLKRDGIEYGGAVGAGAITGAFLGGPGGALAGTIIGASVISVHLLVSHPQATLENGTVLLFTLSEPLNLVPAAPTGN
jgi:type IV secretory pathway VirB10-like protein